MRFMPMGRPIRPRPINPIFLLPAEDSKMGLLESGERKTRQYSLQIEDTIVAELRGGLLAHFRGFISAGRVIERGNSWGRKTLSEAKDKRPTPDPTQKLQSRRRSYRLQDARKTRRTTQRIEFVMLMDEQQPSIVLLQSTLQQSQSSLMIAQHGVDASQIYGRNITSLRFRFQATQNQKSFFLLAAFYERPSQVGLSFERCPCEAHALFICGNGLRKQFAPLICEAQVHVDAHIVRIERDGLLELCQRFVETSTFQVR